MYCNHSIIITRDIDFVPPVLAALLYPPVEIIKEDQEGDSGVALKPSKAESHVDTPPSAQYNQCENTEESIESIKVKTPAPRKAVDDEAAREVLAASRTQSSQKDAGIFYTPQFHDQQSHSELTQ